MAPRYRSNTLEALALPEGAYLQFRYVEPIVEDDLVEKFRTNQLKDSRVLLGHVDCSKGSRMRGGRCRITPLRYGKLVDVDAQGPIFSLTFELLEFAYAPNLAAFLGKVPQDSPHWVSGNPRAQGKWCRWLPSLDVAGVPAEDVLAKPTRTFADWQVIAKQLTDQDDFKPHPYFYKIEGLFEVRDAQTAVLPLPLRAGELNLAANRTYELRIAHLDPQSDVHGRPAQGTKHLLVDVSDAHLKSLTNPRLGIDCPYDIKTFRFMTSDTKRDEHGFIWLHPEGNNAQGGGKLSGSVQSDAAKAHPAMVPDSMQPDIANAGAGPGSGQADTRETEPAVEPLVPEIYFGATVKGNRGKALREGAACWVADRAYAVVGGLFEGLRKSSLARHLHGRRLWTRYGHGHFLRNAQAILTRCT